MACDGSLGSARALKLLRGVDETCLHPDFTMLAAKFNFHSTFAPFGGLQYTPDAI